MICGLIPVMDYFIIKYRMEKYQKNIHDTARNQKIIENIPKFLLHSAPSKLYIIANAIFPAISLSLVFCGDFP